MNQQHYLLSKLRTVKKNSHGADGMIAAYILNNLSALPILTLNELASKTNTSYATVCRFFRKITFGGFREFKAALLTETDPTPEEPFDTDFVSDDLSDFSEISEKICDFYSRIIRDCKKNISADTIKRIAEIIHGADMVLFVGLGTSAISAQYAYTKFFRIKSSCVCDRDIIISKMKAAVMTEKSVLFAISSSGRTKSILDVAKVARACGATVISLGDFARSPLSRLSDIGLSTSVRESNKYIDTDFPMIQSQITIIDILYSGMYQYLREKAKIDFQKTVTAVLPDKDRSY